MSKQTKSAEALIDQARSWIGCKESDGTHHKIIDTYNAHKPLARGYAVTYKDSWCATFVSACAIKTGMTDIIPIECSCPRMISMDKEKGIYTAGNKTSLKAGDILFYDWQSDGTSDHVGIVEQVAGGKIIVIEGNYKDSVGRRVIDVGHKDICGFARPKYEVIKKEETKVPEKKAVEKKAVEKKPYPGEFPSLKKKVTNNAPVRDAIMAFAKKYADDNSYHYKKWTSDPKTHQCPICHKDSGKGWNCIGYVSAILYHGGNVKSVKCSCSGLLTNSWAEYDKLTIVKWRERNGKDWDTVYKGKTPCKASVLKKGDVILIYNGNAYKHTAMYAGDGYIYDATPAYGIAKRKYSKLTGRMIVFRYNGGKTTRTVQKPLEMNDTRTLQVERMQKFLCWAGFLDRGSITLGKFGKNTLSAVKKFQKKVGITSSGKFGEKTLAAAKKYKK